MQRSLKELEDYLVRATDGEVGHVTDFLLDDDRWAVRYLVVRTGGFFDGRKVLISPIAFREMDWSARTFHLALTMTMVNASPDIDTDKPVSRQHERVYNSYYGYPYYWNAVGTWGMGLHPALLAGVGWKDAPVENADEQTGDAHWRSASELRHYHVQGPDNAIGHVTDFIADDVSWSVQYLVVDTSNWWFGRKVLIAPRWAHRVSWQDRNVFVDMTREAIQRSPEWDGAAAVNHQYEQSLHDYYGIPVASERHATTSNSPSSRDDQGADAIAPESTSHDLVRLVDCTEVRLGGKRRRRNRAGTRA